VAGEWVIGCASSKPIAYGFVFLALERALRDRPGAAGLFAGLATCFHVLVGGWATLALGGALLVGGPQGTRLRTTMRFGLTAGALSLIGLGPALRAMALAPADPGARMSENAQLYVEWATPFHLDPAYFLSPPEYVKLAAYFALTIGGVILLARRRHRWILAGFLGVLSIIFLAGLLARAGEAWGLLQYYPFRVADGVFPLAFWLGAAGATQVAARRWPRWAWLIVLATLPAASAVRWANNQLDPRPEGGRSRAGLWQSLLRSEPRLSAYWLKTTGGAWLEWAGGRAVNDLAPMFHWIRDSTPTNAVFIIPPWRDEFSLHTGRNDYISSKTGSVRRQREVRARLEALNGGEAMPDFRALFRDLTDRYLRLTADEVIVAAQRFPADYILTTADYDGAFPLAHRAGLWRLYRIPRGGSPGLGGSGVPGPAQDVVVVIGRGVGTPFRARELELTGPNHAGKVRDGGELAVLHQDHPGRRLEMPSNPGVKATVNQPVLVHVEHGKPMAQPGNHLAGSGMRRVADDKIPALGRREAIQAVHLVHGHAVLKAVPLDRCATGRDSIRIDVGEREGVTQSPGQQRESNEPGPGAPFECSSDPTELLFHESEVILAVSGPAAVQAGCMAHFNVVVPNKLIVHDGVCANWIK
jgi:hypothetical protein